MIHHALGGARCAHPFLDGLDDLDIPIFEDLGGSTDEKPNWPGVDAKQTGGRS